jgi:hypothetical protein
VDEKGDLLFEAQGFIDYILQGGDLHWDEIYAGFDLSVNSPPDHWSGSIFISDIASMSPLPQAPGRSISR